MWKAKMDNLESSDEDEEIKDQWIQRNQKIKELKPKMDEVRATCIELAKVLE